MSMELIVYGGGDKVVDYLNAVASIVNSGTFRYSVYGALLISLIFIILAYFQTHQLEYHKLIISVIIAMIVANITTTVVVTDKRDPSANYSVDHVPITLAFPACLVGAISDFLIETFSTAYSTPSGGQIYGYVDKNPMFLPKVLDAHMNTSIPDGIYKTNLVTYIQVCVAPVMTDAQESALYTTNDMMAYLSHFASKIWTIPSWCQDDGTENCGSVTSLSCYDGYQWLNSQKINMTNAAIKKTVRVSGLPVTKGETGEEITLYKQQLAEAYNRFLGTTGINQATTILNAAITNLLTDGFESYAAQTGNNGYLLSLAVAQARQADSMNMATWAILAAEKLSFLKEYLYLIVLAISPIIFIVCVISGFHKVLLTYFLTLLWLGFWDVANVVTEAIQYHYLDNLQDILSVYHTSVQNITYYADDIQRILHRQIALGGFISATVTPTLAAAMVFGLDKLTGVAAGVIGFGQQAATSAGTSVARGDISLGNQNLLNNSTANENIFNKTMHNRQTWGHSDNAIAINGARIYDRGGSTEALENLGVGRNITVSTGIDISSQIGTVLQHSRQAVENAINQFASNKAVRDTYNTAYTHALSRFKNFNENNLSNYTQSEIDSYKTARDFVRKYGYSEANTHKIAAAIDVAKNTIRGYNLGGNISLDSKRNILTNLLGKALGLSGKITSGYSFKDNKIIKQDRKDTSGQSETSAKDLTSSLADYLTKDKSFQKQLTEQFSSSDGVSANSATSTSHILAGSKEFQNARQKLFQALQSYSRIENAVDNIRSTSGINVQNTINTLNYAKEHSGTILARVDEAAQAVQNGTANSYHEATYELAKEVLGVNDVAEMRQKISSLYQNKKDAIRLSQGLIETAAHGQKQDGKLNQSEIALANFLGHTDILKKQEELMKNYSNLEKNFGAGGKVDQISQKANQVNANNIKHKVDSGLKKSVDLHEAKEDRVKKYTMSGDGTDKLRKDFGYDKKEDQTGNIWRENRDSLIDTKKKHLTDKREEIKAKKDDIKKVNPDVRLVDEKVFDWFSEKFKSVYDAQELKDFFEDQNKSMGP